MERAVEIFVAINLVAVGLSHFLQPRGWAEFFTLLHAKGTPGNFFNAMLALGMGSFVVAFHNVWSGIPMIVTIYGWLSLAKGALYLIAPGMGLKSIESGAAMPLAKWRIVGSVMVVVGVAAFFFGVEA